MDRFKPKGVSMLAELVCGVSEESFDLRTDKNYIAHGIGFPYDFRDARHQQAVLFLALSQAVLGFLEFSQAEYGSWTIG